jgi:elongation factor G
MKFESKVISGSVPKEYWGAVQRGIEESMSNGVLAGYPVVGVKATLLDGSYHTVDSSDLAFEQAAAIAVEKAMKAAGPVLLEPVMHIQAVVPEANFGVVQADLLARRGMITDSHMHGDMRVIDAMVPLVEMFGYSSQIRSLTAGRGSFTMEPKSYEKIPEQIAKQIAL